MKLTKFANLLVLGLVLTVAASGCKKKPTPLTVLPKTPTPAVASPSANTTPMGPGSGLTPGGGNPYGSNVPGSGDVNSRPGGGLSSDPKQLPNPSDWANAKEDTEIFKAYTVYFDFDSSAVKGAERSKLTAVADHMKSNPAQGLKVEGNCDERGTEEYNRALGERRALAIREELIRLGVNSDNVLTTSFGKDKPAVEGHDEAAWSKNRRGDFVLLVRPVAP